MNPRALSDWVLKQNLFARIRQQKPEIHCITNYVTAGDVADLAVNGRLLMKDRQILTLDEEKILFEARTYMERTARP